MILQFFAAMGATASFAVLFETPKKQMFLCALAGAAGWISYLIFCELGTGKVIASLLATLLLTLLSRIFAAIRKNPVTLYLLSGIFTLVPGAGIYYTSYHFIMGDMKAFAFSGIETFKIAGAIAIGIIFGFAVPQKIFSALFSREQKQDSQPR